MKPYKILRSKNFLRNRTIIGPLKPPKPSFWFFAKTHTPLKAKLVMESELDHRQDSCFRQDPSPN